jgi:hypothetical protein
MRKLLPLMLILMVFITSCKSPLDKPVVKDNFVKDINEIEAQYPDEYSYKDYLNFRTEVMVGGIIYGDSIKGTYRENLDKIKAARLKEKAATK